MANENLSIIFEVDGGESLDGKSGKVIAKQLKNIARNISSSGDQRPKIVFDVDIEKTNKKIESQLKRIAKNISLGNVKFDFDDNKSISKKVKDDLKKAKDEIRSFANTAEVKALNRLYVGDRAKGSPIDNIVGRLTKQDGVSKVNVAGTNYFDKNKEQLKSFSTTVTYTTGEVQKLNFELANIGKRKGFVQTNTSSFKKTAEDMGQFQDIINKNLNNGKLGTSVKSLEEGTRLFKISSPDVISVKENVNQIVDDFQRLNTINSVEEKAKAIESLNNKIEATKNSFKQITDPYNIDLRSSKDQLSLQSLINTAENYGRVNNKLFTNATFGSQFHGMVDEFKRIQTTGEYTQKTIDDLTTRFKVFDNTVSNAGLKGQTFASRLQAQVAKLGIYVSGAAVIMGAIRQVRQMVSTINELDKTVTDLSVATGYNRKETEKLLNTYSDLGKELGATTTQVAGAADDWLRQGHSIADTNKLIQDSMMLSKLGKIGSDEATTALTATMKAYGISVNNVTSIVDKFTAVDNKAAVSAGGIAKAMQETAISARLAGIDINRLTGYIASVGEVSQDGMESVGTFYKTLFARMGNIKAGKLIDPETQEDISNSEITLNNLDIKLRENGKEFRNFGTILDEVYGKWGKLSNVSQKAIAVAFGGVRNQEKFFTLMEHYSEAMKYAEISAESTGTAVEKFNNSYLTSVEASQDRFVSNYQQFSQTILNSDLLKFTYDGGSGLLGFFTELNNKLGSIPVLATTAAGALSAISNKGRLEIKEFQTYICPFATDGNIGQDQYKNGVLCLGVA